MQDRSEIKAEWFQSQLFLVAKRLQPLCDFFSVFTIGKQSLCVLSIFVNVIS